VTKCLSGSALRDSLGGDFYEGSKFALRGAEVTLSKLMRHSDMKLTAKVYTDETQLPIYDAIKRLPRLLDHTQIRAQISGAAGQNVAQAGAASEGKERAETPVNGGVCHALACADAMGQMERAKGFEPSTLTLAT